MTAAVMARPRGIRADRDDLRLRFHAGGAGDREGRLPGAGEDRFGRVFDDGVGVAGPGEPLVDVVAEHVRADAGLIDALLRDVDAEVAGEDGAGVLVFESTQELAGDAEARRGNSTRVAGVHAVQHPRRYAFGSFPMTSTPADAISPPGCENIPGNRTRGARLRLIEVSTPRVHLLNRHHKEHPFPCASASTFSTPHARQRLPMRKGEAGSPAPLTRLQSGLSAHA